MYKEGMRFMEVMESEIIGKQYLKFMVLDYILIVLLLSL